MDPDGHKRQKISNEPTSSPGTQSQSDILLHNRRLRLQFLEHFSELKTGSVTQDLKEINKKRCELIGIIERLQQVPIQRPVPKSSDATLYDFGLIGSNYSSDNVIDLDADTDNVEHHTQANVDSIVADSIVSAIDSDNKDKVKSFGDENSSSNKYLLLAQPEIIRLDNCSSSTEPQVLFKHAKHSMDTDNVSAETKKIILFESHSTSERQTLIKQGCVNTNIEEDVQEKGKVGRTIDKYVGSYEVPCEIVQNEPQSNENDHREKDNPFDELDDLWMGMSVALACSEQINQVNQSIVPIESNNEETEDACDHDFRLKDDLGIVCHICGLI
ncbi:unnamed protein product [Urochloa humidicola]